MTALLLLLLASDPDVIAIRFDNEQNTKGLEGTRIEAVALSAWVSRDFHSQTAWDEEVHGPAPAFELDADGRAEFVLGPRSRFEHVTSIGFRATAADAPPGIRPLNAFTNATLDDSGDFRVRDGRFPRGQALPSVPVRLVPLEGDVSGIRRTVIGQYAEAAWSLADGVADVPLADMGGNVAFIGGPPPMHVGKYLLTADTEPVQYSPLLTLSEKTVLKRDPVFLMAGVTVRGKLDDSVPRPVRNGRVFAPCFTTSGVQAGVRVYLSADVEPDGTFELADVPQWLHLYLSAVCDGYSSGTGEGSAGWPEMLAIDTRGMASTRKLDHTALNAVFPMTSEMIERHDQDGGRVTLPMTRTASVEFRLSLPNGRPAAGVEVRPVVDLAAPFSVSHGYSSPVVPRRPPSPVYGSNDGLADRLGRHVTDADGVVRFASVPAGRLDVARTRYTPTADNPLRLPAMTATFASEPLRLVPGESAVVERTIHPVGWPVPDAE